MFLRTLVSTYESTRRHNPEEKCRHLQRHENLKSHTYDISLALLVVLIITVPHTS
jgi:hypothetical protein